MSKINDLIKELCPNGVRFYQIKDIAKVTIGEFVHKNIQGHKDQKLFESWVNYFK